MALRRISIVANHSVAVAVVHHALQRLMPYSSLVLRHPLADLEGADSGDDRKFRLWGLRPYPVSDTAIWGGNGVRPL